MKLSFTHRFRGESERMRPHTSQQLGWLLLGPAPLGGFVGMGVSLVLFVLGLRHLDAARTGTYFSPAPFIGALVAIVFLGDPLTAKLAVAGLLMAVGLWLHLTERHQHAHPHETLEDEHGHFRDEHHDIKDRALALAPKRRKPKDSQR